MVLVALKRALLAIALGATAFALWFVVLGFIEAQQERWASGHREG